MKQLASLVGLVIFITACSGDTDTVSESNTPQPTATAMTPWHMNSTQFFSAAPGTVEPTEADAPTQPSGNGTATGEVVNIVMTEDPYVFEPDNFDFELGKTYTLIFEAPGEFHTFTINDLGIEVNILPGETVTQTVTFEQAGDFQLICVPHESLGMVGAVTVS